MSVKRPDERPQPHGASPGHVKCRPAGAPSAVIALVNQELDVKNAILPLLFSGLLAGCHQTAIETKPPPPSGKNVALQIAEQECQKASRFKGLKILAPFFSGTTEEKYRDCMKKRGYPVPSE